MSKYCNRYMDDAPGIRADCAAHLLKRDCVTCPHRNIRSEVVDLRAQVLALQSCERSMADALRDARASFMNLQPDSGPVAAQMQKAIGRITAALAGQPAPKSGDTADETPSDRFQGHP